MNKFTCLTSQIIPLDVDNVDTDMIIPAQHLKSVSKQGFGEHLFSNLRQMYPEFILNQANYQTGKILLSKANFGCGSSREHAVWALQQYGIQVIVCSSFSDIFFNNAAKNGLLLIQVSEQLIDQWLKLSLADSSLTMTIDLVNQQIKFNATTVAFHYDKFRKHCLVNGLDDLDYLLSFNQEISNYEQKYSNFSW
jgi:3-isopropylmalate/(R)-2-methylmalate dehydratase small subunit